MPASGDNATWGKWRQRFDAIVFDLDDTLVPCPQPVRTAIAHIIELAKQRHQRFGDELEQEMTLLIKQIKAEQPLLAHNVTELRTAAIQVVADRHGIEHDFVEQLVEAFLRVRSDVDQYVYEDVEPVLEQLKGSGLRMGLLSNGNAELTRSSLLSRYFELYLSAADVGASKPSRLPFVAVAAAAQTRPGR